MLIRAGVAGVTSDSGERERVERAGVEGNEERRVTVAVSLLVWRVWTTVLEPAVDGREEGATRAGSQW